MTSPDDVVVPFDRDDALLDDDRGIEHVVFQPRKMQRSGLRAAVEGSFSIHVRKERVLDTVAERFLAPVGATATGRLQQE